jgi:riboflavin kinase / FMN adenylyltransferase
MIQFTNVDDLNNHFPGLEIIITMGNFDGVHLGHKSILKAIVEQKKSDNQKFGLVTFVPHPRVVLKGDEGFLINDYKERISLISDIGLDFIVELRFDRDFSTQSPESFLNNYILRISNLKGIYLGHDFAFGANKKGTHEIVKKCTSGKNIDVYLESEIHDDKGVRFSSTDIRNSISNGEMKKANGYLGRNFYVSGSIVKGQGRGKKIGFPTANILCDSSRIIPKNGVYKTKTTLGEMVYQSITNVGVNPTFKDDKNTIVETNIFDFDDDIYGETIKVEFIDFIRDEKKFTSVNELIDQISKDVAKTKDSFKC